MRPVTVQPMRHVRSPSRLRSTSFAPRFNYANRKQNEAEIIASFRPAPKQAA